MRRFRRDLAATLKAPQLTGLFFLRGTLDAHSCFGDFIVRVLIGCEYSGAVRDAFAARGHYAVSCDLLDSETPGQHYRGDLFDIVNYGWDLLIAFPPCTHLAVSGARHFAAKRADGRQQSGIDFFMAIARLPIKKKVIENPVGIMSTVWRRPDQIIQPWQFGHGETKATCLWLENIPKLVPTNIVSGRYNRIHRMPPGENRAKERSRTYPGIANAMAQQWG